VCLQCENCVIHTWALQRWVLTVGRYTNVCLLHLSIAVLSVLCLSICPSMRHARASTTDWQPAYVITNATAIMYIRLLIVSFSWNGRWLKKRLMHYRYCFRNIILTFSSHVVFYVIFCMYFICTQLVGTCCKLPCLDMMMTIIDKRVVTGPLCTQLYACTTACFSTSGKSNIHLAFPVVAK